MKHAEEAIESLRAHVATLTDLSTNASTPASAPHSPPKSYDGVNTNNLRQPDIPDHSIDNQDQINAVQSLQNATDGTNQVNTVPSLPNAQPTDTVVAVGQTHESINTSAPTVTADTAVVGETAVVSKTELYGDKHQRIVFFAGPDNAVSSLVRSKEMIFQMHSLQLYLSCFTP